LVTITTGTSGSSRRSSSNTSIPVRPGICSSSRTRSYGCRRTSSSASSPFATASIVVAPPLHEEQVRARSRSISSSTQRGVRVAEVVAAAEYRARPGYRAALATLWIPEARELAGWLAGGAPGSAEVLREAGRQIARMHAAGIAHPDLNLRNLLVAEGPAGRAVHLIDFDRARAFPGAVPGPRRARDLRRLARSARKLRAPIGPAAWEAFREGYGAAWPLSSPLG
jgi:tRNA A-37 threonylcarbamoyl transferase component Bud32